MFSGERWVRIAVAALAVLGSTASVAFAQVVPTLTVKVDCARGESIAHALAIGDERNPLLVLVEGTCTESVFVARSDVTLAAGPGGGARKRIPRSR